MYSKNDKTIVANSYTAKNTFKLGYHRYTWEFPIRLDGTVV